jgi:hypothetical protein
MENDKERRERKKKKKERKKLNAARSTTAFLPQEKVQRVLSPSLSLSLVSVLTLVSARPFLSSGPKKKKKKVMSLLHPSDLCPYFFFFSFLHTPFCSTTWTVKEGHMASMHSSPPANSTIITNPRCLCLA